MDARVMVVVYVVEVMVEVSVAQYSRNLGSLSFRVFISSSDIMDGEIPTSSLFLKTPGILWLCS